MEFADHDRRLVWVRGALGASTVGVGVAALAWPGPTVRVIGVLFGLNLVITGVVRAVVILVTTLHPVRYRVLAAIFGVATAVFGVLCLRHAVASAVLLTLVVGFGWPLEGVPALTLGVAARNDPVNGWRLGIGVAAILTAVGVFLWPALSVDDVVAIAAGFFVVIGTVEAVAAIAELRAHRSAAASADGVPPA
jgi:uncharacterized membrane protein HdeD (DUF308 family)